MAWEDRVDAPHRALAGSVIARNAERRCALVIMRRRYAAIGRRFSWRALAADTTFQATEGLRTICAAVATASMSPAFAARFGLAFVLSKAEGVRSSLSCSGVGD